LAKSVLTNHHVQNENFIKSIIDEIQSIGSMRNAIAHNGFSIVVDEACSKGVVYEVGIEKRKCRDMSVISIKEVLRNVERLKYIQEQLFDLMSKVLKA
jgi:hypothetical protein